MIMDEIKNILKAYNFTSVQIADFIQFYNYANTHNIPYPEMYAIMKMQS